MGDEFYLKFQHGVKKSANFEILNTSILRTQK